jgi:hypothetical protein
MVPAFEQDQLLVKVAEAKSLTSTVPNSRLGVASGGGFGPVGSLARVVGGVGEVAA